MVTGDFQMFNGQIAIGITGPGDFDQLAVGGYAALSGSAVGILHTVHKPIPANTKFPFLLYGSRVGDFIIVATPGPKWTSGKDNSQYWFQSPAEKIAGLVREDVDHNAQIDLGEPGLGGIVVTLTNTTGQVVGKTTTDPTGAYAFSGLDPADYTVTFTAPSYYTAVAPTAFVRFVPEPSTEDVTVDLGVNLRAVNDAAITPANMPVTIPVLANDELPTDPPLTLSGVAVEPLHGTATVSGSNLVYTPNTDFVGTDTLTYQVQDAILGTATATVTIRVTGDTGSIAGVAWADRNRDGNRGLGEPTQSGVPVDLLDAAGNILANALTATGGAYSFAGLGAGTVYQVRFMAPPDESFSPAGGDSAADPATGKTAFLTLAVGQALTDLDAGFIRRPKGSPDGYTAGQDTPLTVSTSSGVLANDTDPDGNTLTAQLVSGPAGGTLTLNPDGSFAYVPSPGFTGTDTFRYQPADLYGPGDPVTVTITVLGKPTVTGQSVTTAQDTAATITLSGTDPNTPPLPLTYTVTAGPLHGSFDPVTGLYTPFAGYSGPDSFQFAASNGTATSDPGTVSITVIGKPTAGSQSVTIAQDTAAAVTLSGTDPNTPPLPLTYTVITEPGNGMLVGSAPNLTYIPDPGFYGADSFQFVADNGTATSDPVTVSITVVGKPTAGDQSVSVPQNGMTMISLTGTDPNTPPLPLAYTVTVGPSHGTLMGMGSSQTYMPNPGYVGPDSFRFTAANSWATSDPATVTITVTDPGPTANPDSATTAAGAPVTVSVLMNDVDPTMGGLTVTGVSTPMNGTATFTAGAVTYTPNPGFSGGDYFTYTITDSHGLTASAGVNVMVTPPMTPPPPPMGMGPTANPDSATTTVGVPVTVSVLVNDLDPAGGGLTVTGASAGMGGTTTFTATTVTYTPGFSGADSFSYTIVDINGATATGTVYVMVTPPMTPPPPPPPPMGPPPPPMGTVLTANPDSATTAGETVTVYVVSNDVDPAGGGMVVTAVTTPAHGTATFLGPLVYYTPTTGYSGADSFVYTITDINGATASATVSVMVMPPMTPPPPPMGPPPPPMGTGPTANSDSVTTSPGVPVTVSVLANDVDPAGGGLTVTGVSAGMTGTTTFTGSTVTFTPTTGYSGPDSFTYTITDVNGATATGTVYVTILSVTSPPPPPPAGMGSVSGLVWGDANGDGLDDNGEVGLFGVAVELLDGSGNHVAGTSTGMDGSYSFAGLAAGTYQVQFTAPTGDTFTAPNATGRISAVEVAANQATTGQNAGLVASTGSASISGSVAGRLHDDGHNDNMIMMPNVTVELLDGMGNLLASTTTGMDGSYSFTGLVSGTYEIQVIAPNSDTFTYPNATGLIAPITLTTGQQVTGQYVELSINPGG